MAATVGILFVLIWRLGWDFGLVEQSGLLAAVGVLHVVIVKRRHMWRGPTDTEVHRVVTPVISPSYPLSEVPEEVWHFEEGHASGTVAITARGCRPHDKTGPSVR